MRFSVSKMGLFWTFFEPFMQVFIMVTIKYIVFGSTHDNFDFAAFLALNFTAYNMFRNIINKSLGSFTANKKLFIYKQVKPIDTIIARVMVEVFVTGVILLAFVCIGSYFQFDLNIQHFPMVAFGFLWLILFSFSLGLFLAVTNTFYPSVGRTIKISMIFIMFGSAIFYSVDTLPTSIQTLILYNPLTHFMEMLHGNYFYVLDDTYVDYNYMLLSTLLLLYVGLWFYKKLEERIISL